MKNLVKTIGIIALIVVIGTAMVSCGGGGGDAKAAAKAIGANGKIHTLSKDSDFVYELTKIDGQDFVVIKGVNLPNGFKEPTKNDDNKTVIVDTLSINVPSKIEGYTVGVIEKIRPVNKYYTVIVSVTLPDTIIELGDFVFEGEAILSIKLPKNLKRMGHTVFARSKLTGSITIPEGVTLIPSNAFQRTKITEIVLHDGITIIGDGAFADCSELTTVKLPSGSVQYLWWDNINKKSYVPASEIGSTDGRNHAFRGCSKLSLATRSAIEASGYMGDF